MAAASSVADLLLGEANETAANNNNNNNNSDGASSSKPGIALNARGALRRFELRHTWPLPSVAEGLSASIGARYDPDLQRRGRGGILRQLGLSSSSSPSDAGAELTAALVWRSRDGLSRLSVSEAEMAAKRGWKFSAGPITGVLGAEVKYPLAGFAAPRRDQTTGLALSASAPELPNVFSPGAPSPSAFDDAFHQQSQQERAPKVSFSVDDVKPAWAYAAAVGAAVLLGAPVSLYGQQVSIGLPGGDAGLPRRLAARFRGSARHRGWLSYALDVDEVGGALEIGPLLKLGGGAVAAARK